MEASVKSDDEREITEVEERKKPGPKPGSKRPHQVPLDVIAANLPNIKFTKKQLKELRTNQTAPAPKRERTEAQKQATAKGLESIKRWQAERRAKKAEESANYVPLVSHAHGLRKDGKKYDGPDGTYEKPAPKATAPSPPSEDEDEDVSESSASEPEATETELSTTDAEAVGLKGRRRVTRQTKAAVKQLAVVNKALGPAPEAAPAAPRRAPAPKVAAPEPAPAPAKPTNPYATMLAGVWRPRV